MALDRFGYGTEMPSTKDEIERYNKWLEPHLKKTKERYPNIPENRIRFQTLSDILEESTFEDLEKLKKQGIAQILNLEYNKLLEEFNNGIR